ncbi:MAG: hypothetical protein U0Y10_02300 [Spirosomataceae bacterium]
MKSCLPIALLLLNLLLGWEASAQTATNSVKAVQQTKATTALPVDKLLPQLTPKSPNVAAMAKYIEQPVSYYTGLPTIEIPLHTVSVGSLQVPITLSYHASGNRVNDMASWVGLGWSLKAGGAITSVDFYDKINGVFWFNYLIYSFRIEQREGPLFLC